ncbi:MAG: hypothetical protein AAGA68_08665 [Pseudomonadota bacterium]
MTKLTMSIVLAFGVSGAAGAPVLGAFSAEQVAQGAPSPHPVERVMVDMVSRDDAEIILLRLGVDPSRIEHSAHGVIAPLTLGQRSALARLESVQLR